MGVHWAVYHRQCIIRQWSCQAERPIVQSNPSLDGDQYHLQNYLTIFEKIAKYSDLTFSDLEKLPLERFNQIHHLAVYQHPHWEASWQDRTKVIRQFFKE